MHIIAEEEKIDINQDANTQSALKNTVKRKNSQEMVFKITRNPSVDMLEKNVISNQLSVRTRRSKRQVLRTFDIDESNSSFLDGEDDQEGKYTDKWGRSYPHRRWGKNKDRQLFKLIREMEKEGTISLQSILNIKPEQFNKVYRNKDIRLLAEKYEWKTVSK